MTDIQLAAPSDPLAEHGCLHAAVIVYNGRRVWFPCRSHDGGVHRFLARPDSCLAAWCRLAPGHRGLHDIPAGTAEFHDAIGARADDDEVIALCTLQFSWGGLFDFSPADDYAVHLVRETRRGTPGPTLCDIDRFAEDAPGWSRGGGISGPGIVHVPCPWCADAARDLFPGLPIAGSIGAKEMAAELGVGVHRGRG